MAKFQETGQNEIFKCDECNKKFFGSEIVLERRPGNISMPFVTVMAVAQDGTILQSSYDKLKDSDQMMYCPHCNHVHFNGFDPVDCSQLELVKEIT